MTTLLDVVAINTKHQNPHIRIKPAYISPSTRINPAGRREGRRKDRYPKTVCTVNHLCPIQWIQISQSSKPNKHLNISDTTQHLAQHITDTYHNGTHRKGRPRTQTKKVQQQQQQTPPKSKDTFQFLSEFECCQDGGRREQ